MVWNFMVTEYLRKSVRVEGDSYEEAYDKVVDAVNSERIVLDADDFAERDVQTVAEYENSRGNARGDDTHSESYDVDVDLTKEGQED